MRLRRRTKQRGVGGSLERMLKRQRLQDFNVELVPVRNGAPIATGDPIYPLREDFPCSLSNINPLVSKVLMAVVRSRRRLESEAFGQRCMLKTNHFFVRLLKDQIHQYDVRISPEVISNDINRAVMEALVSRHSQSDLSGFHPVYDGRKHLYTAGPLPFTCKTFEIELEDAELIHGAGQAPWRVRQFKVVIKLAACVELQPLVNSVRKQEDEPHAALQVLGVILREISIGMLYPFADKSQLDGGLEICQGFYKSLQLTKKGLLLNIDASSTVVIKPMHVTDYVAQILDINISGLLCDGDRLKITEALEGVLVQFHNMRKKYRVFGLTLQATRDVTVDGHGTTRRFLQYFEETYNCNIKYTDLPCLQVGNKQSPILLPMEVCKIAEGQRYLKQLNQKQMSAFLEVARLRPQQREMYILQSLSYLKFTDNPHVKEFGIEIENEFRSLEAHVLPSPWLKFHDDGRNKEFLPHIGQWNMIRKRMFNGGKVRYWACVNFCWDLEDEIVTSFCHELTVMCRVSGIDFSVDPVLPVLSANPEDVECTLKSCHQKAMNVLGPQARELDLLIVILPNKKCSIYGDLKRICETDIGLASQCCVAKNVINTIKQLKPSKQYLANIALKINVKVGGKNVLLLDALTGRLPCVGDVPTIIFGAHVMHPGKGSSHSIAAVVASQDWPEVTNYTALAGVQAHCKEAVRDLFHVPHDFETGAIAGGMIIEHLISFKRVTGWKPQRIIFYRDAVSNGQLYEVLSQELVAIKKACSYLEPDYNPSVTYVVLQKHRRTRLFVERDSDGTVVGSGNVLPGTVVDSDICHPNEFGFFLCSQYVTQGGTTRPVHYHILWDENRFRADTFKCLTNYLCYSYTRCTHSISIVPPVRYARLMASRGRLYMESTTSESGTSHAHGSFLPAVKDSVRSVMFYC